MRNLIEAGHIAPGDVDERSIEDVRPSDLRGYTQCHFFAGIGVWSYALRLAGWPDDRPVWTGSCPCQPFSAAGKGLGFDDERHLWPAWAWLIGECRPPVVFGEQVASKDVEPWIDLVQADVEAMGYALGCVPFPSAGVGAPHIRDRSYFVAHTSSQGLEKRKRDGRIQRGTMGARSRQAIVGSGNAGSLEYPSGSSLPGIARRRPVLGLENAGSAGRMADADSREQQGIAVVRRIERDGSDVRRAQGGSELESRRDFRELADTDISTRRQGCALDGRRNSGGDAIARARPCRDGLPCELANSECASGCAEHEHESGRRRKGPADATEPRGDGKEHVAGPTNGFWRDADWLLCRDEKWRPVEPRTFPLGDGAPSRVGRLRAYGNAINPHQAAAFIEAADEAMSSNA
ncbi:DNA cytosine methyltransferase [Caballeronia sp. GAFFF2]|uniref:DNA cytosine methyltransferase n=1 Tax=Caballeronia sp. GAFFF2 TaxID=2921741 RepID=UPI0020298B33|nr:DNA cytosine methyltransferase [Caballeronia sp. GAFFF2]